MFNDTFKHQYKTIPFATFTRNYKAGEAESDIESFSHCHKEIEILYVWAGEASYYIDAKKYDISKGDIVIVNPYLIHRGTIYADKSFSHYCICFDLKLISDEQLRSNIEKGIFSITPLISHAHPVSCPLSSYLVNAYDANKEKLPGWELNVTGNLSLFFSKLLEHNLIIKSHAQTPKTNFCYDAVNFISKYYDTKISSVNIAKSMYLSDGYFCRKFKSSFGCSFQKYVEMYRIEKAKILLKSTSLSVSEISAAVGFNDFSYFSKEFKKITNHSPSQYRNTFSS